ncbi:alpha/beta hydrolase family protein [Caulobacter hibisci]|uniref:S9 family peptidase n=1 Tax=Caulobacter hibisci TaxID=2035993 RepID=A0ABS0SV00_9CAUL|nr:S9 family peptidase [Caulobacter hibisci]MBI1683472.1 S9 family peptidase [Caulobacter hibisci]
MLTRRLVIAAASTAPLFIHDAFAADGDKNDKAAIVPPSIDELLKGAEVLDTALSPDGSRVAILIERLVKEKTEALVVFYDTSGKGDVAKPVRLGQMQVEQVEWANEDRLLIWTRMEKDPKGRPTGMDFYGEFIPIPVRRLVAIGADGADAVVLFNNQKGVLKRQFNLANVVDRMNTDPRRILMQIWDVKTECETLYLVDVYSGEAVFYERGSTFTDGWDTQNGVPVIRYDSNSRGTVVSVYARAPGEKDWKLYRKVRRNELKKLPDLDFVAPTPEPGVLLMLTTDEGADMPTIRRFDTKSMQVGEVFSQDAQRPIDGVFFDEAYNALSVSSVDDRTNHRFLDPKLAAHYKGLNNYFGNECNVRPFDVSRDHKRFIFHVSGPRHPGAFWLYDVEKKDLELLGESRPWLSPERLAPMKTLKVKTRDGQTITAYLSTPVIASDKPRPMVVLPHGGPEVRDTLDFDLFVQTFAAQGWLVLQPNFRGSGGYGKAFADSGRKHWGDLMQEDVEDAIAQVIASGAADPNKIAICGASYGGYAALMGAVRKPELYKAVVAIAGDADLVETLAFSRSEDGADSDTYAYWVKTIGDPKTDKAKLIAASPSERAAEIKAPVLLIHGTEDTIVTPKQSKIMAKALKAAGKPYELVEMKGVGHRDWSDDNWKMLLTKSVEHIRKGFA